jgi:hypothetical protein
VNWNISTKKKLTPEKRREHVVNGIKEKTKKNGYCIIRVTDGLQRELFTYRLSHKFLVGYFEHVELKGSTHNMGCLQCRDCGDFHRLRKLESWSDHLDLTPIKDWKDVFKKVKINCGGAE